MATPALPRRAGLPPTTNGAGAGAVAALPAVDEVAAAGGAQAPAAPYSNRHRRRSVRLSESMPNPAAEPQFLVVLLRRTLRGLRPTAAPGRWPPPQRHATARRAAWPPHSLAEPSPPAARTEATLPSHTAAGRQSELRPILLNYFVELMDHLNI